MAPTLPFSPPIQLPTAPGVLPRATGLTPVVVSKSGGGAGGSKKPRLSKEQLEELADRVLAEYVAAVEVNLDDTLVRLRELPGSCTPMLLDKLVALATDRREAERAALVQLLVAMSRGNLASSDQLLDAFDRALPLMADLAIDVPFVRQYVGQMLAQLVAADVLALKPVARLLHRHAALALPTTLALLQQMLASGQTVPEVKAAIKAAGLDVRAMLPAEERADDVALLALLEQHQLDTLYPFLRIRRDLDARLAAVVAAVQAAPEGAQQMPASAKELFAWLKEQPAEVKADPQLVTSLVTSLLEQVTAVTTLPPGAAGAPPPPAPDDAAKKRERELLKRLAPLLAFLTNEQVELQVAALYAVQVFSFARHQPKGLILRFFMGFYDFDIAEDAAFKRWREEINDSCPGKGEALVAVNDYLNWLETAESEEDEEEEED